MSYEKRLPRSLVEECSGMFDELAGNQDMRYVGRKDHAGIYWRQAEFALDGGSRLQMADMLRSRSLAARIFIGPLLAKHVFIVDIAKPTGELSESATQFVITDHSSDVRAREVLERPRGIDISYRDCSTRGLGIPSDVQRDDFTSSLTQLGKRHMFFFPDLDT